MSRLGSKGNPFVLGEATHPGETGKNNEDSYGYISIPVGDNQTGTLIVAVVADGIGGQSAGEEAANLAVTTVKEYFLSCSSSANLASALKEALWSANTVIHQRSQERALFQDMGTTATVAVISDDKLYIANVGDSRTYLISEQAITQLSIDHSWGQEAVESGRLSPQEARHHPNRNVLRRYLGITPDVDVDLRLRRPGSAADQFSEYGDSPISVRRGETILLCTDGLTDLISDQEIWGVIRRSSPQQAADRLVQMARRRGGHDNITVLILHSGEVALGASAWRPKVMFGGIGALVLSGMALVAINLAQPKPEVLPTFTADPTLPPPQSIETQHPSTTAVTVGPMVTRDVQRTPGPSAWPTSTPASIARPSSTPVPTHTPVPTRAPTSAVVVPQPTQTTQPGPRSAPLVAPTLLEPPAYGPYRGQITMKWQPAGPLPEGAAYEVVWWYPVEDGDTAARAFAPPTADASLSVNLDGLFDAELDINWTVLIVQLQPYHRLTLPSGSTMWSLHYRQCSERQECDRCEETYADPQTGETKTRTYDCNCRTVCD